MDFLALVSHNVIILHNLYLHNFFQVAPVSKILTVKHVKTTTNGYAITTNDVVLSNLNVVAGIGHVIVAITTRARVAGGGLRHVTQNRSSA